MSAEFAVICLIVLLILSVCNDRGEAAQLPDIDGIELREEYIPSSVDGKVQPVVTGVPAVYSEGEPLPLLVGLHTWSSEYTQMVGEYGKQAARRGWLLVCPHFRGPNLTTNPNAAEAGGSVLAQHDIIDAIDHVRATCAVDPARIYIIGGSGGGHMTALMCTKYPDVFAAGVSYCPITDFVAWHSQQNGYAKHIEAVCGGKPGDSPEVDFEYARRSPRTFITNAANCHLLLAHGDKDGTIWPEQTWETFRALKHLPSHRVLFESWSAGHSGKTTEGLDWASGMTRDPAPPARLDIVTDEAKSYFWLNVTPAAPLTFARCTAVLIRDGQRLGKETVADHTSLSLKWQDASRITVDLKQLILPFPAELPDGMTVEGDALVFVPEESSGGEVTIRWEGG